MRITRETIVAVTRAFGISQTEGDVEELNARLMLDEPVINNLETFEDVSTLPTLKSPRGLPSDSIAASTPQSLTENGSAFL